MLNLPFLDLDVLLVLSLFLLDSERHILLVFLRDVVDINVELVKVSIVASEICLLTLKDHREVVICCSFFAKLDLVDSTGNDASWLDRV